MRIAGPNGLDYRTHSYYPFPYLNHISDISPTANPANLTVVYFQINQMSNSGPFLIAKR